MLLRAIRKSTAGRDTTLDFSGLPQNVLSGHLPATGRCK